MTSMCIVVCVGCHLLLLFAAAGHLTPTVVALNKGDSSGFVSDPCAFSEQLLTKLLALLKGGLVFLPECTLCIEFIIPREVCIHIHIMCLLIS